MAIKVTNWINDNRKIIAQKGMFKVIEHQKDLSVSSCSAENAYFASQMNVRLRQLEITLNGSNTTKEPNSSGGLLGALLG